MSAYLCDLCGRACDYRGMAAYVSCEIPGRRPWVKPRIPLPQGLTAMRARLACYDFEWKEANVEMEHATV